MRVYPTKYHKLKILLNRLPSKGNIYNKLFKRMLTSQHLGLVLQNENFPIVSGNCWTKVRCEAMGGGGAKGWNIGHNTERNLEIKVKCGKNYMIFSKIKFHILISSIVIFPNTVSLQNSFLFHSRFVVIVIDTRPPSASSSLIPDSSRITNSSVWPATCDKWV